MGACSAFSGSNAVDDVLDTPDSSFDATVAKDGGLDATGDGGGGDDGGGGSDAALPKLSCDAVDAATAAATTGTTMCSGSLTNTSSDPRHCGRCEHDCLSALCILGVCQPNTLLAVPNAGLAQPDLAGVDTNNVYWRVGNGTTIYTTPKGGGADAASPVVDVADAGSIGGRSLYGRITLAGRFYGFMQYENFTVQSDGGDLRTFPPAYGGNILPAPPLVFVAGRAGGFYQYDMAGIPAFSASAAVPWDLAVTPNHTYAFVVDRTGGGDATPAAVEAGALPKKARLSRLEIAKSVLLPVYDYLAVSNNAADASLIAASNDYVFFVEGATGDILRLPANVGLDINGATVAPTRVWQAGGREITELQVEKGQVYFAMTPDKGTNYREIHFISECGGRDYQLTQKTFGVSGLLVDGAYVYWADSLGIHRTPL
jgi:hypothetical protein